MNYGFEKLAVVNRFWTTAMNSAAERVNLASCCDWELGRRGPTAQSERCGSRPIPMAFEVS